MKKVFNIWCLFVSPEVEDGGEVLGADVARPLVVLPVLDPMLLNFFFFDNDQRAIKLERLS